MIGIGNSARRDDGLGWALLDALQDWPACPYTLMYRFQLQPEDAASLSQAREVVFVDATARELPNGFAWTAARPESAAAFSTHRLEPGAVLYLCDQLYDRCPEARLLVIQGYNWSIGEGLSSAALRNLDRAVARLQQEWSHQGRKVQPHFHS